VHAIVKFQGRQYRVQTGDKVQVPLMDAEPGSPIVLDQVLLVHSDAGVTVGQPNVGGAAVDAVVLRHLRGPKIIVGKYKKRKDYRRRNGYRDDLTEIEIGSIRA
jgi:large subunit ribosomal protein L21